jgi:hypothetical protein
VLSRLPYLALPSMFALVRLLPISGTDKDIEILAALLHHLPRVRLQQLQLIVSPDTVLR